MPTSWGRTDSESVEYYKKTARKMAGLRESGKKVISPDLVRANYPPLPLMHYDHTGETTQVKL